MKKLLLALALATLFSLSTVHAQDWSSWFTDGPDFSSPFPDGPDWSTEFPDGPDFSTPFPDGPDFTTPFPDTPIINPDIPPVDVVLGQPFFDPISNPNDFPFTPTNFDPKPGTPIPFEPTTPVAVNFPPVLAEIGNRIINEGQTLQFSVSGTDPEGLQVAFFASNLPSGAAFQNQAFSWTPDFTQAGIYQTTFGIVDSTGQQDLETITITVLDGSVPPPPTVNHAPIFLSEPVTEAFVRDLYFARVTAFDEDGDDLEFDLAQAPDGMRLSFLNQGLTVFGSWVLEDETETETALETGHTFTVSVTDLQEESCTVTINDQSTTLQEDVNYLMTIDGIQYFVTAEPDFDFGDCYIEIVDMRIFTGWLLWTPQPDQAGANPVTLTVTDGIASAVQQYTINVTVDVRPLKPEEPRAPKKDVRVNTIAMPHDAQIGDNVLVTLNFENSGDLKLENVEAGVSIPELGIRSPSVQFQDLRINKDTARTLVLEIPDDAAPGLYTVRVTIDSGSVHRVVHRDIEIVSD